MKAIDADGRGREEHFLPAMQACTHAEVKAQEAVSLIKYTCSSDWRCFIMQKILMLGSVLFLPRPQLKIIQHPAFQHVDFDALMINKKLCKSGTVKTEASMPPPPPLPSSCQSSASLVGSHTCFINSSRTMQRYSFRRTRRSHLSSPDDSTVVCSLGSSLPDSLQSKPGGDGLLLSEATGDDGGKQAKEIVSRGFSGHIFLTWGCGLTSG